ncbi:Uncharacterized integral membrane protein [Chryseobacterium nakagawai]|uniref:LapA family protein n=1 Tax=Chryseobacterium nakagawai TaxID=1241982 RepID=A0AAD0YMR6_CHRNA|nr:LapA family protein [Chryseobacterium nakagawai]VEH22140.1 Uncharacterized integral membrane protein [Chryseobacterium nakagawai]
MKNINIKKIIDILMIILLIIFIIQNLESVMVKFMTMKFELPLIVLILAVFALGYYTSKVFRKR